MTHISLSLSFFFPPSPFSLAFLFPVSPGPARNHLPSHARVRRARPASLLWMRVLVMLVVVGWHAGKGGRWADSNLDGDTMPVDSVACVQAE
ncbi:hypothetical protein B0H13DRAFT_2147773 [Mycena leptocephala]|nr:hypothetical protein B0H13DRAFT_2147773 [Mycena leptocephala]